MERVCAALGTWQIIILISALRLVDEGHNVDSAQKDHLVLYGNRLSPDMKIAMEKLAYGLWHWQSVIWADDLMCIEGLDSLEALQVRLKRLSTRIGANDPYELWLGKLAETPEKLLVETYPDAGIVLYEDGMHSYVSPRPYDRARKELMIHPLIAADTLRLRLICEHFPSLRVRETWLPRSYLKRTKRLYLYLAGWLTLPAVFCGIGELILLDSCILRYTIDQASKIMSTSVPKIAKDTCLPRCALVIGQCFARWKILSRQVELTIYQKVVSSLINCGYHVFWKEHPRVDNRFYPELSKMYPVDKFTELNIPNVLPIEMVAGQVSDWVCLAASSSTLIYLNRLYGISTYTFAHWFGELFEGDFKIISKMILESVPWIEVIEPIHVS